jgi:hypothetical protein
VQIRILSKCTGNSVEKLEKDISRPRYFDPYDAIKYGIIDKVKALLYTSSFMPNICVLNRHPNELSCRPPMKFPSAQQSSAYQMFCATPGFKIV